MAAHARTSTRSDKSETPSKRASRNSSVETLRILAMLMIVVSHCVMYTNLDILTQPFGINKVLIETFLFSGGKIGVVAFFAISAWYLSEKGGILTGLRRVWILERELLFWSLLLFVVTAVFDKTQVNASLIIWSFFPMVSGLWWYSTAYGVFLLLFPFLAQGLRSLGRSSHGALAVVMFVLFTGLDILMPFSSVGLPGGNYLSFVYIYVLITYYRWYMQPMRMATAWQLLTGGYLLIMVGTVIGGLLYARTGRLQVLQVYLVKVEFRLPVLMVGVALFVLFERREFHSAIINTIAVTTFGVYLVSEYPTVRSWIWDNPLFDFVALADSLPILLIPAFIGAGCLVFLACAVLDMLRELLFSYTIDRRRGRCFDLIAMTVDRFAARGKETI